MWRDRPTAAVHTVPPGPQTRATYQRIVNLVQAAQTGLYVVYQVSWWGHQLLQGVHVVQWSNALHELHQQASEKQVGYVEANEDVVDRSIFVAVVLNSSFFAESKVRAPTVSNCFPLHFQKKMGLCGKFFFAKKMRIDNFGMIRPGRSRLFPTVSDRFRLFPTVSDCFSFSGTPVGPVDHWFNKNHNIQHFSSRPFCAQVARNDAFWLWNPIYPKNPKTPRNREI